MTPIEALEKIKAVKVGDSSYSALVEAMLEVMTIATEALASYKGQDERYWERRCEAAEFILGYCDREINKKWVGWKEWEKMKNEPPSYKGGEDLERTFTLKEIVDAHTAGVLSAQQDYPMTQNEYFQNKFGIDITKNKP